MAGLAPSTPAEELTLEETVVTASKREEPVFSTVYSVDTISAQRIQMASFRTIPDIFREVPGTLVQKTSYGQGSPYIRGFTGYRNLFLVDGIRLNNAVFRDGPNQYWSTVDSGSIQSIEVVRGPESVLYGSDAIGGTVNVISRGPTAYTTGQGPLDAGLSYRYGQGEDSHILAAYLDAALGQHGGLLIGGATKNFGDIESGNGELRNTGYDERTFDGKLVYELSEDLSLTLAHSRVNQDDVPRTHSTIYSRPFAGTTVGNELRRDLDQDRMLSYMRLQAERGSGWESWSLTLFHHRQEEERHRARTGDRYDVQGLEVNTLGFNLAGTLVTRNWGELTSGLDWAHDAVDSWSSSNAIQGPVADDSSYDWAGAFLQYRQAISEAVDVTAGIRLAYLAVDAGSISDPESGSRYSYQDSWTQPVGNLRLGWRNQANSWRLYGGISQGFRAPNLSDLTRFDTARSNEFEIPATDLNAEKYTQYELGVRFRKTDLVFEGAVFYTDIEDQIQRLLTGNVNADGEWEVTKANVGDGELYGVELKASWSIAERWLAFGHYAWLDGRISAEARAGERAQRDYHSRMMPTNYRLGVRYSGAGRHGWWAETEFVRVAKADRLSLRDQGDTQRIPPGGTPGYSLWHLRGGIDLTENLMLIMALENLLDQDYRVHGSGQNEPGRNFVVNLNYTY